MSKPRLIKAKVGSYQGSDGTTKNRYIEVGKLMEGERGPYILLSKWFSPSGIETEAGRDSVILSIFDQKDFDDDIPSPAGKKFKADGVPF